MVIKRYNGEILDTTPEGAEVDSTYSNSRGTRMGMFSAKEGKRGSRHLH